MLEVADRVLKEELGVAALLGITRPGLEDIAHESIVGKCGVLLLACVTAGRFVLPSVIAVMVTTGDIREQVSLQLLHASLTNCKLYSAMI